jgi:hypothetical protein
MTAVLMVFTVKVSLARGAASPFEMRIIQRRRADQLTMPKKIMGREPAASAALKIRDEEQLRNFGGPFESVKSRVICTATVRLL